METNLQQYETNISNNFLQNGRHHPPRWESHQQLGHYPRTARQSRAFTFDWSDMIWLVLIPSSMMHPYASLLKNIETHSPRPQRSTALGSAEGSPTRQTNTAVPARKRNELNLQTTESVNPCFIILNLQCKNQHTEYLKPQKFLFASENSAASSSQTPLPFGHWPDLGSQDGNSPVPALKNASENVAQENHEWENDIQHRHTLIVYRHEQNSW